jgi:hypothetical protein
VFLKHKKEISFIFVTEEMMHSLMAETGTIIVEDRIQDIP